MGKATYWRGKVYIIKKILKENYKETILIFFYIDFYIFFTVHGFLYFIAFILFRYFLHKFIYSFTVHGFLHFVVFQFFSKKDCLCG